MPAPAAAANADPSAAPLLRALAPTKHPPAALPDGTITRVGVIDMENSREGEGVLVWPGNAPLRNVPLPIRGN
ncbi:hypothetical protein [Arthrobacter ramosus]|uniref:hypothetical protein n=1 Tax=Arthrobacter ramosus TaxID=1672 RepID=UPI001F391F8E|nr:hypothetical protein [Arthrobacter ramosus]